jgi:alanyl-tRNA synthetase
MTSNEIRQTFLDFFTSRKHHIVPSAPMVIKNDPTLMFTNAGMNQFKDIFLGNSPAKHKRIADTQKCLRVSGKHNDLEEVGIDTYHHTMFEMLGNWSFGDYFKKEAIDWAWELLTEVYKIDKDRLYATVFGGDKNEGLEPDSEAFAYWKKILPEEKICYGTRKDNFWEMGDTGPCGPCSEIHVDLRSDEERNRVRAQDLINKDNPLVIEIWNLVFIEFNRQSDGKLSLLPARHVDTGMGFERLCMVVQGKKSNYDTDVFQNLIGYVSEMANISYSKAQKSDVAMRVIADHLRAVVFAIADGQLPSNNKAGYVIRRILRRAIRYGYSFLNLKEPFINELVPLLVNQMSDVFPEIKKQQELIKKVITEEEIAFLRTLSQGIKKFEDYINHQFTKSPNHQIIDGKFAFELLDTYGFPIDLTQLMAKEIGWEVHMIKFNEHMEEQKSRSREDAEITTDDWVVIVNSDKETEFVGYDAFEADARILRYRKVKAKGAELYQLVLDKTPFYAESGGQVGDRGYLTINKEQLSINNENTIYIEDTKKENNLIVHITKKLPSDLLNYLTSNIQHSTFSLKAIVDVKKRILTMNNHSATHLMNAALKQVLGNHVEQKGSLVDEDHLRFDFSHFTKVTKEEITKIETIVNARIRENIKLKVDKDVPIEKAMKEMGAVGVFGEKYGDFVRVVSFDKSFSIELCGGTHVPATGQIGFFKIISENAIAAGIRRIEAITADKAEEYINSNLELIEEVKAVLKYPKDLMKGLKSLVDENANLNKQIEQLNAQNVNNIKESLGKKTETVNGINFIAQRVELDTASVKDLAFSLNRTIDNLFLILANESESKANITVMLSENLIKDKGLNAVSIIKELAKEIQGGGGGSPHFATAGGKNPSGIESALNKAREMVSNLK